MRMMMILPITIKKDNNDIFITTNKKGIGKQSNLLKIVIDQIFAAESDLLRRDSCDTYY